MRARPGGGRPYADADQVVRVLRSDHPQALSWTEDSEVSTSLTKESSVTLPELRVRELSEYMSC